jgi:hypothetical protein
MNAQNAALVPILNDADIASGSTGAEVITYGQPIPFIFMAVKIAVYLDVYSLFSATGTNTIRILGEYSIDGVNWKAFASTILAVTAAGIAVAEYSTTAEFGPLVRFNVSISNGSSSQASARLSAVVKATFF